MPTLNNNTISSFIALLIVSITFLIYSPGLSGPFIFDDFDNIVNNKNLNIQNLSLDSIQKAANSLSSGFLGRPISALSFSLNYYLADDANNPSGFKLFNLIIHSINGLLLFWLTALVFFHLKRKFPPPFQDITTYQQLILLAGSVALLWVVHPIQLTSVLYVVQRMTSMAAMFIFLALICYLYARTALQEKQHLRGALWLSGLPFFGLIAILCKETGLLLPLYVAILELILFSQTLPWNRWSYTSKKIRWSIKICASASIIFLLITAIQYSLPTYSGRDFTLLERLLTESRVLVFYIGQILLPQPSAFGLYHDGFVMSHSLLEPLSTLPALIVIISLPVYALVCRNKHPLLSLGILWFYVSHVLESTFYPLELVHEHRNYLASVGLIFILFQGFLWVFNVNQNNKIWIFIPTLIIFLSSTTFIRSNQWGDLLTLLQTQTQHHPKSPRAWMDLSNIQFKKQQYINAVTSTRNAILLSPEEPAYSVYLHLYANLANIALSDNEKNMTLKSIRANPQSTKLTNLFHKIDACIESSCRDLQPAMELWLKTSLEQSSSARYLYYLGSNLSAQAKLDEALYYLNQSIKIAPNHISPYIDKIQVLLKLDKTKKAKKTYADLEKLSLKLYGRNTEQVIQVRKMISSH